MSDANNSMDPDKAEIRAIISSLSDFDTRLWARQSAESAWEDRARDRAYRQTFEDTERLLESRKGIRAWLTKAYIMARFLIPLCFALGSRLSPNDLRSTKDAV